MKIRADGRWGGKLTSRELLSGDPSVDALGDSERAELARVWLARSATEYRVASSFEVIRDALSALRADSALVAMAHRAIDDEHRHAEICRFTASCFAARELDLPEALPFDYPKHARASEELRRALWVVGQCCFNETLAAGFLETASGAASGPMAQRALKELLSDEVDHARLGWAFLASLPPGARADIGPWLPALARANLRMWREAPRDYPATATFVGQGAPSGELIEEALQTALRDLILPGLETLSLPVAPLAAWLAEGAPTASS
ncbi:MAG: hypothetical protein HS104_40625 [Polyangiaceae bacterium]|nr:hypothetical protein [Polyangiaceae bacterium]MCE7893924.1 hypothetical protein [Sorangiineae bacterium PRO1]MCL4756388.1 hypothetical protein [Myxococcales bacterium]